ncbi:MAG: DUF481 domain-containing protein [Deltaproteobacteria bacterium]|nr:DUF481 domain-containing protein [Deltaproteobacteria bacterium]
MVRFGVIVVGLVIGFSSIAFGQEDLWTANAGFSGIVNTGNAENTTVGGNSLVSYKFDKNLLAWTVEGAYGRAKDTLGNKTTNTKNWKTGLRYDRFLTDPLSVFTLTHIGQNKPAGFDLRYGAALGLAHFLIKTDSNTLKYEVGYDYTREQRVAVADDSIHSARAYSQYTHKINKNVYFAQDLEALFNIEIGEDMRLNALTSLNVALTERAAFQVGYQLRFDNQPVVGFKKLDTQTQMGLSVNFL